jgi:integration host factor subunit beta
MIMTKGDLIDQLARHSNDWTRNSVENAVNTVFDSVAGALTRGDRVEIRGLGSFQVKERLPRVGRNPKTGVRVPIPAQLVPSFTAGKHLKRRVQEAAQA